MAVEKSGDFAIVWQSLNEDNSGTAILCRRYQATGTPLGGAMIVNTYTTSAQAAPDIAMDADGDFAVVWQSYGQDGDKEGIYGQRYSREGLVLGGEFQVHTFTTAGQNFPVVTDGLIQLPRDFRKAMGLAVDGRRMAIATQNEVVVLADEAGLARNYAPDTPYDALFLPRAVYYTGEVDIHDMEWGKGGLYAVNTRFSCLSIIDDHYSFRPWWVPGFIPDFAPLDFCHLNGMALEAGQPRYVTLLGKSTSEKGWRQGLLNGGMVMDVSNGEVVLSGLPMPHSPRLYDGFLYLLLSATGELIRVDLARGTYEVITRLEGFVRGLARIGDYLVIGLSKLRKNASTFHELPIAEKAISSGLEFIHLPTGIPVAHIRYQASVEEIYDVKIIPGRMRPSLLNHDTPDHRRALNTPEYDFWSS